jgi:hypothetical protein
MHLSPRAKRVIDLAFEEARQLDHKFIGTEHLLLGLIREGEGLAGRVLSKLGVGLADARDAVRALQGDVGGAAAHARVVALERLEERLRTMADENEADALAEPGDIGEAAPSDGRATIEMAADALTLRELRAVYRAKDRHGYQQMLARGDGMAVVRLPGGTPLKRLDALPAEPEVEEGFFVRVLGGEFAGRAGWIFAAAFRRVGPDEGPFPPEA